MKKLVIVCEEKLHRYGDFLAQLISGTDDKEDAVVGIKDGSAAAQVWTEKEYSANAAQISSEQYILFIGDSKLIKEKRHHMQKKYSEYGMNYGWLGKQAVLFVDHALTYTEYEEFYKLVIDKERALDRPDDRKLLPGKNQDSFDQQDNDHSEVNTDNEEKKVSHPHQKKRIQKVFAPLETLGAAVKKTADAGLDTINKISNDLNAVAKGKEIEDQQYTYLVLLFYLNDLAGFLGLKAE